MVGVENFLEIRNLLTKKGFWYKLKTGGLVLTGKAADLKSVSS